MSPDITLSWVLALVPEIGLLVLLAAVLIYDRAVHPQQRRRLGLLTAWGALTVLVATLGLWFFFDEPNTSLGLQESLIWGGMIRHDMVTLVFRVMFLVALFITSLISLDVKRLQRGEYFALLITATIGFSLMAAASDLIMIYVALETASISSYVLAGFVTNDDRSAEAGMKYFVYGAFATSVMLYGMSLLYGMTASTNLYEIGAGVRQVLGGGGFVAEGLQADINAVLILSAVMIIVGFGFKISAVPFHFWTPDVYEGAPTPFTGFLSTASKVAGFAILLRVLTSGLVGIPEVGTANTPLWWSMLVAMTVITMTLGNFVAIFQRNIKRLLAYSSIAQAGYAMIGLVVFSQEAAGALMFYLLMYVFSNIAAFGGIVLVSQVTHSENLDDFNGLSRRSPYLALVMLFALLSLSGIPPTAGFFGKFFLFKAAIEADLWGLALIGVLNAFVGLYYYLSVVKVMYLYRSDEEDVPIPISRAAWTGMLVSLFFILYLGVFAGPAYEWTMKAAESFLALAG